MLRRQCRVTAAEVATWRAGRARVSAGCGRVADVPLLALERRQVYELAHFAAAQETHRLQVPSHFAAGTLIGTPTWCGAPH